MVAALLVSLVGLVTAISGLVHLDPLQTTLGAATLFLGSIVVPTVPPEIVEERRRERAHLKRNERAALRARRVAVEAARRRKKADARMARRARHASRAVV